MDTSEVARMQRYVASVGITPAAVRRLGAGGFVRAAQDYLAGVDLKPLATIHPQDYPVWLESVTDELMERFPIRGMWGPARKCVNIFMVMASLNRFLCAEYRLDQLEGALEVPLDSQVANALLDWARGKPLPDEGGLEWKTIKRLHKEESAKFQKLATAMAAEMAVPRGRLDALLWQE